MILTAAALLGCYEKDPIPEGLTEDNFYIGTFTFTDFADGEKPESYTVEITKNTIKISDSDGKVHMETEFNPGGFYRPDGMPDYLATNHSEIVFNGSKDFSFEIDLYPEPTENNPDYGYLFTFKGTEKGVSYRLVYMHDMNDSLKVGESLYVAFSNAVVKDDDFFDPNRFTKIRCPQTLEWNGKRYKSTLETAFTK